MLLKVDFTQVLLRRMEIDMYWYDTALGLAKEQGKGDPDVRWTDRHRIQQVGDTTTCQSAG